MDSVSGNWVLEFESSAETRVMAIAMTQDRHYSRCDWRFRQEMIPLGLWKYSQLRKYEVVVSLDRGLWGWEAPFPAVTKCVQSGLPQKSETSNQ